MADNPSIPANTAANPDPKASAYRPISESDEDEAAELPRTSEMAQWYDVLALFGTIKNILVSSLFSERFDHRMIELPMRPHSPTRLDCFYYDPDASGGLWFDYVADVGDGFHPTYRIAQLLAQSSLKVYPSARDAKGERLADLTQPPQLLPRGRVLVMGGDEVYPSASRAQYRSRFVLPYTCARLPEGPAAPSADSAHTPYDLLALPGNHDWYDGLAAFLNTFTQQKAFGSWQTRQERSYFVASLPHNFWLFAVDTGLTEEIDKTQQQYFDHILGELPPNAKIILCCPEPVWVHPPADPNRHDALIWLTGRIRSLASGDGDEAGRNLRIVLRLAGDLHHYQHHRSSETAPDGQPYQVENLIAGGGGAFLHPTNVSHFAAPAHRFSAGKIVEFKRVEEVSFPSPKTCNRLLWRSLILFANNRRLMQVLTMVYALGTFVWIDLLKGHIPARTMTEVVFLLLMARGLATFADVSFEVKSDAALNKQRQAGPQRGLSWLIGTLHATAHLVVSFICMQGCEYTYEYLAYRATHAANAPQLKRYFDLQHIQAPTGDPAWLTNQLLSGIVSDLVGLAILCVIIGVFAMLAAMFSCLIFGAYLFVSLRWKQRHANDAFAALRIPDYKNFLRLHLTPDGLTVYAIGVQRVPQKWKHAAPEAGKPLFEPEDAEGAEYAPFLIESFHIPA